MHAHLLLPGLVALASFGCGSPYQSEPVNLRVSVSTTGVDQDDSYAVLTGDGPPRFTRTFLALALPPGEHDVVLEGIAANCAVQGPRSVRVAIALGEVADAAFQVACRAVTGALEVDAPTAGRDFDGNGYRVHLDGVFVTRVFSGGSAVVEGLSPGSHEVRLDDFSANCGLNGPPARTATVTAGGLTRDTVRVAFEGSCRAITGDVEIFTTTGGVGWDPNGYTLTIDGLLELEPCGWYDYGCVPGTPFRLATNGSFIRYFVPPGDHTYEIGDIAPNCTVAGGPSRTVSIAAGEVAEVRFDLTCEGP